VVRESEGGKWWERWSGRVREGSGERGRSNYDMWRELCYGVTVLSREQT